MQDRELDETEHGTEGLIASSLAATVSTSRRVRVGILHHRILERYKPRIPSIALVDSMFPSGGDRPRHINRRHS